MKAAELNHYMLALKLSQSALARLLPINVTTVNRMCRGATPVNPIVARLVTMWVTRRATFEAHKLFCEMAGKTTKM